MRVVLTRVLGGVATRRGTAAGQSVCGIGVVRALSPPRGRRTPAAGNVPPGGGLTTQNRLPYLHEGGKKKKPKKGVFLMVFCLFLGWVATPLPATAHLFPCGVYLRYSTSRPAASLARDKKSASPSCFFPTLFFFPFVNIFNLRKYIF